MTVKGIFKVLLGTIIIMVVGSLALEMINITTTSLQLTQMSRIACRQAAVLFSQETYKDREYDSTAGGAVNMDNVIAADGATYVEGNFYGLNSTPEQIYTNLYTSSEFKEWLNSSAVDRGNWKSIDLIDRALNHPDSLNVSFPTNVMASNFESQMADYNDAMTAKAYKEVMMTPMNMGVPYMDHDTLQTMFQWNLAQLASDCKADAIRQDDNGAYCVYYKGFRVYADLAQITRLEYRVFDMTNSAERQDFEELTSIDGSNLGYDDSLIDYLGGYENDDERERICVVGIEYSIPIAYEGITPIRSIFDWVWDQEAAGLDGSQSRDGDYSWNDMLANLDNGGFDRATPEPGVLPVPMTLIYYVVR